MRILMSGASGFVGAPLSHFLSQKGHTVIPLVRSQGKAAESVVWDPARPIGSTEPFEGFDAVIHLAGEPLTLSRWTASKREKILSSRKESTYRFAQILSSLRNPPKLFLSASATGFYGDRGDELLDESAEPGRLFLSRVCVEWEGAAQMLAARRIRVVNTRFGVVIGPGGGILRKMLLPYRLGLGATIGSGKQWISWVALSDLISAIAFLLDSDLQGAVNLSSPQPVRQKEFSQMLAYLLHRPAWLTIPAFLARLALGQAADNLLLASTRAIPRKLLAAGFSFRHASLEDALRIALSH